MYPTPRAAAVCARYGAPLISALPGRCAADAAALARIVEFVQRRAVSVISPFSLLTVVERLLRGDDLTVDTDIESHAAQPSRVAAERTRARPAFPQNVDLIVVVIDGQTETSPTARARDLAARMRARPDLFTYVRRPDGGEFFDRNGPLFLSVAELQNISDKMVEAQPLIGTLARDPSLRGLFDTWSCSSGVPKRITTSRDRARSIRLYRGRANAVQAVLNGGSEPVPWQRLMTGLSTDRRELRRFVLTRPVLDFERSSPAPAPAPKYGAWRAS